MCGTLPPTRGRRVVQRALASDMSAPAGFYALPLPIAQLSLDAVLRCGQSFRWFAHPLFTSADTPSFSEPKHEYRFALQDRVVCLRQSHTHLFYRSIYPDHVKDASQDSGDTSTLAWIHDYFQLDVDLVKLYSEWSSRDDVFRRTVNARFTGIRILRQDPWENVASWVLTINAHPGFSYSSQVHLFVEQPHLSYHEDGPVSLHRVFSASGYLYTTPCV